MRADPRLNGRINLLKSKFIQTGLVLNDNLSNKQQDRDDSRVGADASLLSAPREMSRLRHCFDAIRQFGHDENKYSCDLVLWSPVVRLLPMLSNVDVLSLLMSRRPWHTLPQPFYNDPDIYAADLEHIWYRDWIFVTTTAELPKRGSYATVQIGDSSIIVVRGNKGMIRAFHNSCRHRGSRICSKENGTAPKLVCPYHQWTYDLKGNLIGVPFRRGVKKQGGMPAGFDPKDHGLQRLAVTQRHGVVFASFHDDVEPLEAYLGPEMLGWYDRVFDGRGLRVLGHMRQLIPANWKLMFENIKDPCHASLLHVFLVTFGLFRADNPSQVRMDETGRHGVLISRKGEQKKSDDLKDMKNFKESMTLHDPKLLTPVKEFPGDATVTMLTLWPNLIIQQQSNTLATRHLITRGPESFELAWTFFGYETDDEEMTQIRLRQANLMGPSGFVSIDDSEVMEFSQAGISPYPDAAGVMEMGGYGTEDMDHIVTESPIRAFYKYYREVMGL